MFIIEILQILCQAIWGTFSGIVLSLLKVLPEFLEIKQMLNALIPTSMDVIAFYLGVPVVLVSVTMILLKVAKKIY